MTSAPLSATRSRTRQQTDELKRLLLAEGFDVVAVTSAAPEAAWRLRLEAVLGAGWHGQMRWLGQRRHWRADPRAMWPAAQSIALVGLNYGPRHDPLAQLTRRERGLISVYAQGADYHDLIKKRLKRAARQFADGSGAGVKVFVDTAPVMEKPLAARAGLGWQGKHTNLVSRRFGSWLFLGAVFTTATLEADTGEGDHCGACRACLDICPTKAFPAPYQLEARRCISYLTIEHDGPIPRSLRAAMGNRIYGCDDCLAVCPWNKFAQAARESAFFPRPEAELPRLRDLADLDDAGFRAVFTGSPVKRIGRDRFVRNVLIAIGNSGAAALMPGVRARLDDASAQVRGAAVWAASRLLPPSDFRSLAAGYEAGETDPAVIEEWRAGRGAL